MRANNVPFVSKALSKAIMSTSRLRNKYLKNPNKSNKHKYNKQRNYCVNLLRKEKNKYYKNLDVKLITDNKQFWKTIKPFFSDKHNMHTNITLIEGNEIILNDAKVAVKMNNFFSDAVSKVNIIGYQTEFSNTGHDKIYNSSTGHDKIYNSIDKDHPSILKSKQRIHINEKFTFSTSNAADITMVLNNLNINKPSTCNITYVYKKDKTTTKENYRHVNILSCISKIFERNVYNQISTYIDNHLSKCLCGFRKGYSTQQCLILRLEKWEKALDNHNVAGALFTDLPKAFDCLNQELLIAKLAAYRFDHGSLAFIDSYLSDRKQRTKVNNSFSAYSDITIGIPQGSILGPLLFNIYLNDTFYSVSESNLTNYADDNTPYAIDTNIDTLIANLVNDTSILITGYSENYFKMNADKCKLLTINHEEDISAIIAGQAITCSKSVKLLGINIADKLDFNIHVSSIICKKISLKLHARISHFVSTDKLRNL